MWYSFGVRLKHGIGQSPCLPYQLKSAASFYRLGMSQHIRPREAVFTVDSLRVSSELQVCVPRIVFAQISAALPHGYFEPTGYPPTGDESEGNPSLGNGASPRQRGVCRSRGVASGFRAYMPESANTNAVFVAVIAKQPDLSLEPSHTNPRRFISRFLCGLVPLLVRALAYSLANAKNEPPALRFHLPTIS
jgi:hypothetical protein